MKNTKINHSNKYLSSKKSIKRNTLILSFCTMLTKVLNFIMIPFFSSWLTVKDYGTFDLFCTYVTLLIPLVSLSSSDGIFRFAVDENDDNKKKYITNGFIINFVNLSFFLVIFIIVSALFKWKLAIPFVLLLIGEIVNKFLQGFLRAIKKLDIYAFCSTLTTVFIAIFVVITVRFMNLGLAGIIIGYAMGYIVGDIIIMIRGKLHKYINLKLASKVCIKQMIQYSFPLIPNSISWWIINVSDRLLINIFLGSFFNGLYAIAYKIPNLCSSVFGVFGISWQEAATEMMDDNERENYYNEIFNKMTSIILSLCIAILSVNFVMFKYVFDIKYYEARLYSPVLVTAIIFNLFSIYYGGIQISLKRPKENGVTTIIGAIVNIVVNILFIKYIGLYAACISTLVSNIVVVYLRKNKVKDIASFKIEKANYMYILVYIYYLIMCYFELPLVVSFINLMLACLIFAYINRSFAIDIYKKMVRKNSH